MFTLVLIMVFLKRLPTGIGNNRDMDTISMLLTGWVIFVFFAIAAVKFLYIRFIKAPKVVKDDTQEVAFTVSEQKPAETTSNGTARGSLTSSKVVETLTGPKVVQSNRPHRPLRRRRMSRDSTRDYDSSFDASTIIGDGIPSGILTLCSGPDTAVVQYVTKCHDWLYEGPQNRSWDDVREAFIDSMNRSLRDIDKKVSYIFHCKGQIMYRREYISIVLFFDYLYLTE